MRNVKDIRLFFALWPDQAVRDQISRNLNKYTDKCGRPVPSYNWHLTLHFIGNTTLAEKVCLDSKAREIRAKSFSLAIDSSGYFRKPKVLWLGCHEAPRALYDLQKKLGDRLIQCHYQPEARSYSPHITVVRKVMKKPAMMPVEPIEWWVDRFVLIESVSELKAVRYRVMEQYKLN